MSYLSVDGTRLYYDETGSGPPLLLVHGLGSSSRDWVEQVRYFAGEYRVLRIDLRGHGRSERPEGPYHMEEFAREVAVLLRKRAATPAHVVGLSMGGMVALQLGADADSLVRSLTIVNSTANACIQTWRDLWFYVSRRTAVQVLGMRRVGQIIAQRLFPNPEQNVLRKAFIRRWARNDKQGYLWSIDAIMGWSIQERLSSIVVPTLLVTAEHDYKPVAEKNRIAAEMPRAEIAVIPDTHHALPVEDPVRFNKVLDQFLTEVETTDD